MGNYHGYVTPKAGDSRDNNNTNNVKKISSSEYKQGISKYQSNYVKRVSSGSGIDYSKYPIMAYNGGASPFNNNNNSAICNMSVVFLTESIVWNSRHSRVQITGI